MISFSDIKFKNNFLNEFSNAENSFLSLVNPTSVARPKLIGWSQSLADEIKIKKLSETDRVQAESVLSGNKILPEIKPFAVRYGGHQFGHWAGQLGDGRAITLGEYDNYEWQLKGSGQTPYSRRGDGRAVLRSSLREFVCSEAMHSLGVPTTRALSLVLTGETVIRDILYDGHPAPEPGAIVSRLSPSFIRFGNFEILSATKNLKGLTQLSDYVITNFYPECEKAENKYAELLKQVSLRTADLMAHWMGLGFVHGVMNTDNMSILGLTIDYGPYGWLEEFNPHFTPNTTDFSEYRYRYAQQPEIALWNLNCLANALYPLINDKDLVVESLQNFQSQYEDQYLQKLSQKLGISFKKNEEDQIFLSSLFDLMAETKIDYTRFFRALCEETIEIQQHSYLEKFSEEQILKWQQWFKTYYVRRNQKDTISIMKKNNPSIVFRNYLAQEAIDLIEKNNDTSLLEKYLIEFADPYRDRDLSHDRMTFKRPAWADQKPGCSILSCSS